MNSSSIVPKIGIGIIVIAIIGYVVFRFMPLVSGPSLDLVSPFSYSVTNKDSVEIVLETNRVTRLVIQGLRVDINKSGNTTYSYQLSEGTNRINIEAYDKYESRSDLSLLVLKNSGKPE